MIRRRSAAVLAGAAVVAALAGCTSDGGTTTTSSAPPSVTGSPTTPPASTPVETPTSSPSAASSTSGTPPPPTTSVPPPPAEPLCAALGLTVTRVPGAAGVTYGLITVTNKGSASCSLPGVPALRLLDASRSPMTAVAAAVAASGAVTVIDPGDAASTLLEDRSDNCVADTRSTFVEVTATTAAPTLVAALSLPPCSLSVKPFTPGLQPSP